MPSAPAESDRHQLMQAAHGFRISQALYVVAKLGIADLLEDGPKTGNELAKRADAHPRALFRVLRVLVPRILHPRRVESIRADAEDPAAVER